MLRKLSLAALVVVGLFSQCTLHAGGLPNLPSSPTYSEPSQIVPTVNALIGQLNGLGTYATQPGSIVSLGTYGTASGATPQTSNTMRGNVTFTGVTVAGVSTGAVVVNNSLITAANVCRAWITADNSAAASFPYVRSVVTGTGTITVNISNAAASTSTGSSTFGVGFDCIQ